MQKWKSCDSDGNTVYIDKNYPKKITNTFDALIAEDFGELPITTCKRCGKELKRKRFEQKFCSRECSYEYKNRMHLMREKYGKAFDNWLNKTL